LSESVSVRTGQGFGYAMDGEKIVNLPNDPELIDLLTKTALIFLFCLKAMKVSGLRQLAVYFFPVLLVGLFFLLRRAQAAQANDELWQSKPECRWNQTQVTFGDVAGDQAKLELNEVVDFLKA